MINAAGSISYCNTPLRADEDLQGDVVFKVRSSSMDCCPAPKGAVCAFMLACQGTYGTSTSGGKE